MKSVRIFNLLCLLCWSQPLFFALATHGQDTSFAGQPKPNFLWITSEDNGPELGCYGDDYADTPNIDALAAKGQRLLNCWSNAPVCAPARTTIISGMFPNSLGAQHMRSEVKLPPGGALSAGIPSAGLLFAPTISST